MEFFDSFPFTKLQGKNRGLDWVIQKIVSFQKEIDKIPEYISEYSGESEHVKSKNNPHKVTAEQVGARPNTWMPTAEEVGARPADWLPTAEELGITGGGVDNSAHIADKNNPHGVTAEQVGARPNTWMPTAEQVGARPNTWMPTAEQVGARPADWLPTAEELGINSGGLSIKLSWENASPTSDFPQQTVSLSLNPGDCVEISLDDTDNVRLFVGTTTFVNRISGAVGGKLIYYTFRQITVSTDGIVFGGGRAFSINGTTVNAITESNEIHRPLKIYLVKGVS